MDLDAVTQYTGNSNASLADIITSEQLPGEWEEGGGKEEEEEGRG